MFKIGAFSQLTGVTVKALRYYDRVALLKPTQVDRFTGYRYYSIAQIDRLNRILALKDLGLSLDEIGRVLCEDPSPAEIRGMLRLKQAQIRQTIEEERLRLQRVEARLRQIEREGTMPRHEVVVRDIPAQPVMSYREILVGPWEIAPLFMRVSGALRAGGVQELGQSFALYHHKEYREYDLHIEVAFQTPEGTPTLICIDETGVIERRTLPAVHVASTLCHMETQADIYAANRDLAIWITENGYRLSEGPCREVYARPACAGEPLIFEVQLPVEQDERIHL